jgi:glycosyltransferase involved in cell wall biosynthesis
MNISYISADFGVPVFGFKGASIHLREMVNAFRKAGHSIHILSSAMHAGKGDEKNSNMGESGFDDIPPEARALFQLPENPVENSQAAGDVHFLSVPSNAFHLRFFKELDRWEKLRGEKTRIKQELRNILYNLTLHESAQNYLADKSIDFVYERYSLFSLAGIRLARALNVPHILEVNAPLAYEQENMRGLEMKTVARETEKEIFRQTDRVLVVSKELKKFVISCDVAEEKIEVLPNAVDPARFSKELHGKRIRTQYRLGEKMIIGFVGSLKPWHGTETLFEAFKSVHELHRATHLLIVGDGPTREALNEFARQNHFADAVTFTGKVSYKDIPEHIAAMDITVAPYTPNENFYFSPIKIFEYMAMGKPVVAGSIGQVQEIIAEGETGLLFTPGDIAEMNAVIQKLVDNAALRQRMGEQGRAWVARERTWDRNAEKVLSLVHLLLQKL